MIQWFYFEHRKSQKGHSTNQAMSEETNQTRSEEEIRRSIYSTDLTEVHLGNYDQSITRPTVASARKSVLWSNERKVYETDSRHRLAEFKSNPYFRFEYPEIPRHWPGTWAVMTRKDLTSSVGRLSRPGTAIQAKTSTRPHTAPLRSMLKDRFATQNEMIRTVKTPKFLVTN